MIYKQDKDKDIRKSKMYYVAGIIGALGLLYLGFYKKKDNKIWVKKITQYGLDNGCRIAVNVTHPEEHEHFEYWLNYLFGLSDPKPDSRSNLLWNKTENVIITYTLNGETFRIAIQNDVTENASVNIDNKAYYRRIEKAEIVMDHPRITYYDDITETLKSFMGPNLDFYQCLPSISQNLNFLFPELKLEEWTQIKIYDSFQQEQTLDLTRTQILNWNRKFSLLTI